MSGIGKQIKRYIKNSLASAGLAAALFGPGKLCSDDVCWMFDEPHPLTTRTNKEDDPLLLIERRGYGFRDIGVDSQGYVYVNSSSGVLKYNSGGEIISAWGNEVTGIDIDNEDYIYTTHGNEGRIEKHDSEGNLVDSWDGFVGPKAVTVDNSGHIYVADTDNQITKIDSEGNILAQWVIKDVRQFGHISDITHDSENNIYVSNSLNNRIEVFSSNGTFIYQFSPAGIGITIDDYDHLYITRRSNIQKLTLDGDPIWSYEDHEKYCRLPIAVPFMFVPSRIAIDNKNGFVYTCQSLGDMFKFIIQNPFVRGDSNSDNQVNISDAVKMIDYLFNDTKAECLDSYDVNDDGALNLSDPINLLNYLFLDGNPPEEPFPSLGYDSTPDSLSCMFYKSGYQKKKGYK